MDLADVLKTTKNCKLADTGRASVRRLKCFTILANEMAINQ